MTVNRPGLTPDDYYGHPDAIRSLTGVLPMSETLMSESDVYAAWLRDELSALSVTTPATPNALYGHLEDVQLLIVSALIDIELGRNRYVTQDLTEARNRLSLIMAGIP